MSNEINWLLTILFGDQLIQCALKISGDLVSEDCRLYPMEPENRATIRSLLPDYLQEYGPIVAVGEIDDIHVLP